MLFTRTPLGQVRRVALLGIVMAVVLVAGTPAPGSTASAEVPVQPRPPVQVIADEDKLSIPGESTLPPGTTTFRVSTPRGTPNTPSRWVIAVRLRPDVPLTAFLETMTTVMRSVDPVERARAVRKWNRQATALGGVSVTGDAPQTFTPFLTSGTYYLMDLRSLAQPDPGDPVRRLTAQGDWQVEPVEFDQVIEHFIGADGQPRFSAPGRLAAHARLLVRNRTGAHEEAILMQVRADTTEQDVQRMIRGEGPDPVIAQPRGITPIAGGNQVVAHLDLVPGRYLLISWVNNPQAMHRFIDVGQRPPR
ncbi:hypothetical protein [Amycolatopsis sp. cmx-11-51]|uniref:hypothetical protein n=1 Tax=Amycolatopsis sp. cmx-11-51 TaxID=2785797 RepID=UPI0039E57468